jgi:hypothetical protein
MPATILERVYQKLQVELAILHSTDEGIPLRHGVDDQLGIRPLAVTDSYDAAQVGGDLDALAALPPDRDDVRHWAAVKS